MPPTADTLKDYLSPDESLETVTTGLFSDGSWKPGSIGLTDRRLLCVSDDGRFVSVGFDAIRTMRSQEQTTQTYRGNDHRLLVGSGSLVSILGILGIVTFATNLFVPFLALLTVAGLASAVYLWRTDEDERVSMDRITEPFPYDVDRTDIRQRCESYVPDDDDQRQLLLLGSAGLAVCGAIGLVIFVTKLFVPFLALLTVVGLASAVYLSRTDEKGEWALLVRITEPLPDDIGQRELLLFGSRAVAVVGAIGLVLFVTNLFVPFFSLVTVSGLASAVYLSRTGEKDERPSLDQITESFPYDVDRTDIRQRYEDYVPGDDDESRLPLLGSAGLAVCGAIGLVVTNGLVFVGVLTFVGGVALVDYGLRHEDEFDGFETVRRQETEMSIETDGSLTLSIRCDQSEELVEKLSRVVYTDDVDSEHTVSPST